MTTSTILFMKHYEGVTCIARNKVRTYGTTYYLLNMHHIVFYGRTYHLHMQMIHIHYIKHCLIRPVIYEMVSTAL